MSEYRATNIDFRENHLAIRTGGVGLVTKRKSSVQPAHLNMITRSSTSC